MHCSSSKGTSVCYKDDTLVYRLVPVCMLTNKFEQGKKPKKELKPCSILIVYAEV